MRDGFSRWQRVPSSIAALVIFSPTLVGCSGIQSALDPAGEEAQDVALLFWVMTIGFGVIWAGVVALSLYASRWKREPVSENRATWLIYGGGVILPVTVLTALLSYALWLMPSLRPFAGESNASLRVEVVGHQFWWQVIYRMPDGRQVFSANEIRMPVGERVEFILRSADMIHSFWIPAIGGKMDLIPGRTNRLSLLATKDGLYRGQCAEFCGLSHAAMAFPAVAMEPSAFQEWIAARIGASPGLNLNHAGARHFRDQRCGECHRVDGTDARGRSGPDLSHMGSRLTIGAGLFDNSEDNLVRFISHSGLLKPGSQMPAYAGLSEAELRDLARWLRELQ